MMVASIASRALSAKLQACSQLIRSDTSPTVRKPPPQEVTQLPEPTQLTTRVVVLPWMIVGFALAMQGRFRLDLGAVLGSLTAASLVLETLYFSSSPIVAKAMRAFPGFWTVLPDRGQVDF